MSLIEAGRWKIRDRTQYRGESGESLSFTSYLRELVLTFLWLVIVCWVHTALLSVFWMGGGPVLLLIHSWNVTQDVPWKETRIIQTLSFSCKKKPKQFEPQKMTLFFSSGFQTKAVLSDTHTEKMTSRGTWCPRLCPFLQFLFDIHRFSFLCMKGSYIVTEMSHMASSSWFAPPVAAHEE